MRKTYLITLLLCCFSALLNGAVSPFSFSSLKMEEGLSQLSVLKIHQDKSGFMWFATRNGLNRYDGNSFVVYKHSNGDSLSLSSNHVTALAEDDRGNLWVGTMNGLNRMDLRVDRVYSLNDMAAYKQSPLYHTWISSLYVDRQKRFWVGTNKGLYLYDYENDSFILNDLEGELPRDQIMVINEDHDGNLLVGTLQNGLYICDSKLNLLSHYFKNTTPFSLTDNNISAIHEDSEGRLWVGTRSGGLNRIDTETNAVTHYTAWNGRLGNNSVRTINTYNGQLVVGTFNGLSLLNLVDGSCTTYTNFDEQKGGLSHFSVFSAFVDNANTLWIGTYAGGVSYSNPLNSRFTFYDLQGGSDKLFGIFATMAYQPDHTLWIASEGRGLLSLDLNTDMFERFLLDARPNALNDRNIIKSLFVEGDFVWCGTQKGTLYRFDTRTKKFSLFYTFHKEVSIYTITRCSDGALWLGTTDNTGIVRVFPDGRIAPSDSVFALLPSVRSFLEIRDGVYLVGMHTGGLALYDSHTHKLIKYNTREEGSRKLYNDQVSNIVKDREGRIWIGTFGGGFCRFDEEKGIMEWLTAVEGLSDDNINSIIPGDDGKLWISTGNGISAYDPESRQFTNYMGRSEIPVNEFSMKGGIKLPGDRIYFSGSNGLVSFYPERLIENRFIPPVVLTSFTVNNKPVVPGDPSGLLDKVLDYTQAIDLDYNQNNFSVGYAALNYLYPNQNKYAYMLEGYDTDWNDAGSRKEAFYTNLKPGDYVFRVRASNNDGLWNDEGRSLSIHIRTPFWQTWYAYMLYLLIIGGILYVVWYYLHMKRKLEQDLVEKQKEQQRQEEFHQSKIRMFTNFSHELRTPLMLILSPLEEVLQRVDMNPNLKGSLRLVYGNAQRLLLLVNQLMDLRKNQSGNLQLRVSHNDLYLFTQEIYIAFNQIAVKERITFRLESDESGIDAWFDRVLLEKVFFNLLSNAFKHTAPDESITIRLQLFSVAGLQEQFPGRISGEVRGTSRYVCLSVEDTGKGIDDSDKFHIFSPFYQGTDESESNTAGTGIGLSLVLSIVKLHKGVVWVEDNKPKGAIFRVLIPVNREAYAHEQFAEDDSSARNPYGGIEVAEDESKVPDNMQEQLPVSGQRYTLLLAEDNPDVRRYICKHLEPYFDVLEAENGVDAFDKIAETLPDLVVSDIMMPKKDGLQLCSEIKQDLIPMLILLLVSKRCTACRRPNMCNKIKKIYIMYKLLLYVILLLFCQCKRDHSLKEEVTDLLRTEIVIRGDKALVEEPVTITAYRAERSTGGIHDFYSEGDYWWPNPINPDSAYIRRDGQTNPDNFVAHRHAMIRFSSLVGDLTSAWLVTKDEKYIRQAVKHIRAWFIAPETRMNPDLQYAQAIKGIVTGRGIGIIDTIHLLEVVQSLIRMEEAGVLSVEDVAGSRAWFSDYLKWLTTHPYGVDEMNAKNNHGTCWVMQVAQFAKYTGDKEILDFCRNRYRSVLLPSQMAEDGSFPLELKRTKPYGYSLFNLDAMATICHILSDGEDDLWQYSMDDGRNMQKAVAWLFPYIADKSSWPFAEDVMFWDEWPVAQPALLFSICNTSNRTYLEIWKSLEHFPTNDEVIRNLPIRHPLLWL